MSIFLRGLAVCIIFLFISCQSEKTVIVEEIHKTEEIVVGGSESVIPLLKQLADGFESEHANKKIVFAASGHTAAGVKAVVKGIFSLAAVSRNLTPEEKQEGLREYWLAHDAIVFATHPTVNLRGLSSQDIRKIYYGEITRWKDLGGPAQAITVLDRNEASSPKIILYEISFFDRNRPITEKAVVFERPHDMLTAIASSPYSIGYSSLSLLLKDDFGLNALDIDGIKASQDTISNGSYPLLRPIGIVTKDEPQGIASEFKDYIFSDKGRSIVVKNGYAPILK